jgi:putative ABC transport system permease protein
MRARHASLAALLLVASPAVARPAAGEPPAILISRQLGEARGLAVGDVVQLAADPTGAGSRPFRVVGVYEPQPDPLILSESRHEVRLHLPDLLELRHPAGDPLRAETVDRINVDLRDDDADGFAGELARRLPGLVVRPTVRPAGEGDPFVVLERFHLAIAIVTVVGSAAFLLALMVMRSDERREVAGILRLIGLSRRRILLAGFVEGALVALAGAVAGVAIATALEGAFNRFFQWYYDTALVFVSVTPGIVLRCILVSVPLGVVAGLVASWTLLRRDVMTLSRR